MLLSSQLPAFYIYQEVPPIPVLEGKQDSNL
jgi:hypothetical protein